MGASVTVWLPNRDAGWGLPAAEPHEPPWVAGGRRTMHELAVALAAGGHEVEFRGEMSRVLLDELCELVGVHVELPSQPRELTAADTVIVNEGVADPRIYSRLALSPARVILLVLAPLGLCGWPFTAEPWHETDFMTIPVDAVARPEHWQGAAALGFELWTNSPGLQRAAEAAGVACTFVGTGQPLELPQPAAEKDIDVVTLASNRWSQLAHPVAHELAAQGAKWVEVPDAPRAEILELFGRSRTFVHPMRIEGSSRLGWEARAMGAVPVILESSPYGAGMDDAGGALVVASVDEMAAAVAQLLAAPERLELLSARGIETARAQVAWEPYVERIGRALEQPPVAARNGASPSGRAAWAGLGAALSAAERSRDAELGHVQAELARHRDWLESTNASLSWRLTAPLRRAKRRLSRG
jgi:hypothetical protein